MSKANPALRAMSATAASAVPEILRHVVLRAAETIASLIVARAANRAYRELAALDDRMLADIGLDRAAVEHLAAINRREAWTSLAHFSWTRWHTGQ